MTILTAHNIGKYFGGQDIFSDIKVTINQGDRIALVGPNGEGKTTLLRILVGNEATSEGQIHTTKGLRIGYLEQHASLISTDGTLWELALSSFAELRAQEAKLNEMEVALSATTDAPQHDALLKNYGELQAKFEHSGGYLYEQTIRVVLTGLGFTDDDYGRPLQEFSGGEQSRAHLAHILLDQPDLLLLDEPTNHLDLAAVEWLENYLQAWPGSMVVVSHDRYFLDNVANRVWELYLGKLESYNGNFSHYVQQRDERLARRKKEYKVQQAFIASEEEFIRRNIAGQRTKEAQGRRKRLERLEILDRPAEQKTLKIKLQPTVRSGDLVLATHNLVVGYPNSNPLFYCPNLEIRRGDCIALLGPNGAGKTTFVKTILDQIKPQTGAIRFGTGVEVGYFAQTQASLNLKATILDEILSIRNLPIGEARTYLGQFLFSDDDVFKRIGTLSGGERSRVALAKLTLTGANFLILDEPTNHLDIPSQENLEYVINTFSGTVLLVSHDRYFVDALANYVWVIEPEKRSVTIVKGNYSNYLAYRNEQSTANGTSPLGQVEEKSKGKQTREQSKAEKREAEKKARQLAEMEAVIATTENKLAELTQQLEAASLAQDIGQLQALSQDYQTTESRLEKLITQWSEMERA